MGSFDVAVPAGRKIIFPPTCVVCQKRDPDSTLKLSFLGVGSGGSSDSLTEIAVDSALGIDSYYGGSSNTLTKVDGIPACKGCVFGLKWYHRLLKFAMYTAWIPGVILIMLQKTPLWFNIMFILVCVVTPPILSMLYPPAFGASFYGGVANFEFKSEAVAREFMRINGIEAVDEKKAGEEAKEKA
jgi:hypothetical protein